MNRIMQQDSIVKDIRSLYKDSRKETWDFYWGFFLTLLLTLFSLPYIMLIPGKHKSLKTFKVILQTGPESLTQ